MINNLCQSFAEKTESQRKELFRDMLLSPVMHTDCTNARVNGESSYVFVCAVPDGGVLYFARGKKGHDGIKGTVVEDYQGTLVHDHDVTFYKYGTGHQECLAHVLRYQSVIFCGQFNTCLSVSLPAPNFRFCPSNLSYPFPALWAILRYSRVRNVFNAAYCTIFRL